MPDDHFLHDDGAPAGPPEGSPRRGLRAARADLGPLRRSRQFRLLFAGQGVSFAGSMITAVALPFQAYALSHSSLVVGLLSVAELLPYLAVGLLGGALADALDRRRLVLVVNALAGHPRLWVLFAMSVLMAALGAVQRPSLDALLPRVVTGEDVPAATALTSLRSNLGQVAGPALAGGLIALAGLAATYAVDVASFAISLLALWRMDAVPPPPGAAPLSLHGIAEGLRYARSRQDLLGTYLVDMAAMVFGMPEALFPQLATHFGGAGVLGLLYTAPAAGSLVVSATSGWARAVRRQGRAVVIAAGAWGLAVAAFGLATRLWVALSLLAVAGGF